MSSTFEKRFEPSNKLTREKFHLEWIANAIANLKEFGSSLGYKKGHIKDSIRRLDELK